MRVSSCLIPAALLLGAVLLAWPSALESQTASAQKDPFVAAVLPDAPLPQLARVQAPAGQGQQPAQAPGQSSSGEQTTSGSSSSETEHQKAEEQIKQEEKQRVAGIVPQFNVSYISNAASLSAGQKMRLAFRSAIDPFSFAAASLVAGYHEVDNDYPGFGWGAEGFGKRAGAAYLDTFDGDLLGNGVLPAIFHQDPRYFRLGYGSFTHRLLYALATSYICKHDNTRKWEPNYSNVLGNIAAGALSNLYYPSQNAGWGQTISNGFIVTTEGTVGGVFQEFWPDVSRKLLHRDPTHGLDAQARAADAARNKAKREARQQGKTTP